MVLLVLFFMALSVDAFIIGSLVSAFMGGFLNDFTEWG